MTNYPIHTGSDALSALAALIRQLAPTQVFVLADEHTRQHCYPALQGHLPAHSLCVIPPGEQHKHLETCAYIWGEMTRAGLDRKALVLDLGGGVIGDMGGFCAATYKRGIAFIQIPTTLLSQVDASVGGKLGIDFQGLKNHIGVFQEPAGVYIYPGFLESLSERELLSGFAEVIKHYLIADKAGWEDIRKTQHLRALDFEAIILHSVRIKADIVAQDPLEKGIRKALNFGHTLGHAVESYFLSSPAPLLHGEAIAIGMICETWISGHRHLLKSPEVEQITQFLLSLYPHTPVPQDAYFDIEALTRSDKKNEGGRVLCTLLEGIGQVLYNEEISAEEIFISLDYYNSSLSV